MYNNPLGPTGAGAGLIGSAFAFGTGLWWLFFLLAAFTLLAAGAALLRALPAPLTEVPRSKMVAFGRRFTRR